MILDFYFLKYIEGFLLKSILNLERRKPMGTRHLTAEEKYKILEEAHQPGATVAEVCRRYQISGSVFYTWERETKQAALEALSGNKHRKTGITEEERLREKIIHLRTVISEITEENLALKKTLGE